MNPIENRDKQLSYRDFSKTILNKRDFSKILIIKFNVVEKKSRSNFVSSLYVNNGIDTKKKNFKETAPPTFGNWDRFLMNNLRREEPYYGKM